LILATFLVAAVGIITRTPLGDFFFLTDSLYRSQNGEVPHTDFISPVGIAFYLPLSWTAFFKASGLKNILYVHAMMGALVLIVCLSMKSRLKPLEFALITGLLLTTAMTGRDVDGGPLTYSWLAPYNRWGWAFAGVCIVLLTVQANNVAQSRNKDAVLIGLLLSFLLYLKVTFFVGMLPIVAVCWALGRVHTGTLVKAGAVIAVFMTAVEILYGNNLDYLRDIQYASRVGLADGIGTRVPKLAFAAILAGVAFSGSFAVACLLLRVGPAKLIRQHWRPLLVFSFVVGGVTFMKFQTHPYAEFTLYSVAFILLVAELSGRLGASPGGTPSSWIRFAPLAAILASAPFIALDAGSLAAHAWETRTAGHCRPFASVSPRMTDLILSEPNLFGEPECLDLNSSATRLPQTLLAHAQRFQEAAAYLKPRVQGRQVVASFEFANPFPYALGVEAPRGALIWMHEGRTFGQQHHPTTCFLEGSDWLVVSNYAQVPDYAWPSRFPLLPYLRRLVIAPSENFHGFGRDLWTIYRSYVRANFKQVWASDETVIFQRVRPKSAAFDTCRGLARGSGQPR
jgi:hypothetical protein